MSTMTPAVRDKRGRDTLHHRLQETGDGSESRHQSANAGSLSDVTSFLGKHGVTPDQVTKLVPALTNSLKGKVSPEILTAFTNAIR